MLHTADEENFFINIDQLMFFCICSEASNENAYLTWVIHRRSREKRKFPSRCWRYSQNLQMFIDWRYFTTRKLYRLAGPVLRLECGAWKSRVKMRSEASQLLTFCAIRKLVFLCFDDWLQSASRAKINLRNYVTRKVLVFSRLLQMCDFFGRQMKTRIVQVFFSYFFWSPREDAFELFS